MDIVDIIIQVSVFITVINLMNIFVFQIYCDFIKFPIAGRDVIFPDGTESFLKGCFNGFSGATRPVFIISLIFYIIFYIFYIIIITVIPETGFPTLFIPIRELLLKLPPFPSLIKYGVIKLIDDILEIFTIKGHLVRFVKLNIAVYVFSKENIRRIFNNIYPELGDKIVEIIPFDRYKLLENEEKKEKEKEEPINKNKDIYKKIEAETDICIANKLIKITPDMSSLEVNNANFKNILIRANCHSKSIGKYIRSNK